MYALNIDPRNPQSNPTPAELGKLGVTLVRYTFKDATGEAQPDREAIRFYRRQIKELSAAGIQSLILLDHETMSVPVPSTTDSEAQWTAFLQSFTDRAAEITKLLARWQPTFQVWQAPDQPRPDAITALPEAMFGRLLSESCAAIKDVAPHLKVISGGLVSGQAEWFARVIQTVAGRLPIDAVAIHPYTKRPTPDWPDAEWGTGYVGDLIAAYRQVTDLPIWITEIGVDSLNVEAQADYLGRFYQTINAEFNEDVQQVFWFCYSDNMAYPFGLVDSAGQPKPAYETYRQIARSAKVVSFGMASKVVSAAATLSLDRLHTLARYLEQNIIFGERDHALHREMWNELHGNYQRLSRADIWRLMSRMLTGSAQTIAQSEIEGLDALQTQKDLYGLMRSIAQTTHQKTGALTGRIGIHVRVSAETEANAATNIEAVMRVLGHVQPGNRMIVTDTVKADGDEHKLSGPDIFETNIYGQHRNGLIDNHAWNLQRLVRTIRDRGFQDRVLLMMRLDGPDGGANVNIFDGHSVQKYELAIFKFIRYLETVLPELLFKLILGNEPDLPHERPWSNPQIDPRTFTFEQYAPALGAFMKRLARQRPDVTFICPALSANLKNEQLTYYKALFGQERPDNLVPALHGYAGDVAAQIGGRQNLLEQQAGVLRSEGKFRYIAGTEIGSSNPLGDGEALSDKSRFDDVVMWLLLSAMHRVPPGQDNNWAFYINPGSDDPVARRLSHVINRSKERVIRNIQEQGGSNLQIIRHYAEQRPDYAVAYLQHNTPLSMAVGEIRAVSFTLRNSSRRTWVAGGDHPFHLGYHWYTADGQAVPAELWPDYRAELPRNVLPDETVTLTANLGAPTRSGAYEVRWDMVEELRTWFAWQQVPTLNVRINVDEQAPPPPPPPPPSPPGGLRVSASHNNQQTGADNLQQAIDNNSGTRWSSRAVQQPGMWFEIDLGEMRTINGLLLNSAGSPQDYPRGYVVWVSSDRSHWQEVVRRPQNDRDLDISFSPHQARYLRIEQIGRSDRWWWSIHEVGVRYGSTEPRLSGRASHNNVQAGADNIAQAFDERSETRWSSRELQKPGMWFEIDLGEVRTVSGLVLDAAGSPRDYPRGYVVRSSTDRNRWEEVARRPQNDRDLNISFNPRPVRYLRIEQTGRSDQWWWSIHEVRVR